MTHNRGVAALSFPGASSLGPAGMPSGVKHHYAHHAIFGGEESTNAPRRTGKRAMPANPDLPNVKSSPSKEANQSPGEMMVVSGTGKQLTAFPSLETGSACEQGRRPTMEDAHALRPKFGPSSALFVVCDGHSGRAIADMVAESLPTLLTPSKLHDDPPGVLTTTFVSLDKEMYRKTNGKDGGAACVAACVLDTTLWIANLGDCRAVVSEGGRAIALTRDHRPTDKGEAARVEAAGGFLAFGRVGGCLAVSRAFGDYELK
eukprot:Sspe_Gene.89435::Locus_61203_Transcript_1_1_Confidence_1.000_Length_819::g.89435::m.89435